MKKRTDMCYLWVGLLFLLADGPLTLGSMMRGDFTLSIIIDFLPDVIGAWLLYRFLVDMAEFFPGFAKLRPLSYGILATSAVDLVLSLIGQRGFGTYANTATLLLLFVVLYQVFTQVGAYAKEHHCVLQGKPNMQVLKFYIASYLVSWVAVFAYPLLPSLGLLINTLNMANFACIVLLIWGTYKMNKAWKEHQNSLNWESNPFNPDNRI